MSSHSSSLYDEPPRNPSRHSRSHARRSGYYPPSSRRSSRRGSYRGGRGGGGGSHWGGKGYYQRHFMWPEIQLNVWLLVVLVAGGCCAGMFAWFLVVQAKLEVGVPWVFPYMLTTASLTLAFVALIIGLALARALVPELILLGAGVLFVLWLTGLVATAIQLFGPTANVNAACITFVYDQPLRGPSIETLAWLAQVTVCNCWRAAFSFELVATVFFLWMIAMAINVRTQS